MCLYVHVYIYTNKHVEIYMCVCVWWMNQWRGRQESGLRAGPAGFEAQLPCVDQLCCSGSEPWAGNLWNTLTHYSKNPPTPGREVASQWFSWPDRTLKQVGRRSLRELLTPSSSSTLHTNVLERLWFSLQSNQHPQIDLKGVAHRCLWTWALPLWAKEAVNS